MADNEELRSESRQALVAGGGSGGHVFPGLALAVALERRGWAVSFVGRPGQIEETLATERGMPFLPLAAAPLVGTSLWQKVRSAIIALRSAGAGARLVRHTGAEVVVGLGGYVSVPAVLGAKFSGRPILLFEPNAAPGVANRFLSRFASEAAVAYRESGDSLSCPVTVTGTPVLPGFFEQGPAPADMRQLLVLGGSQGAQQINRLMPEALMPRRRRRPIGRPVRSRRASKWCPSSTTLPQPSEHPVWWCHAPVRSRFQRSAQWVAPHC
jgi:UDP-N-acetylglucosamine--N-acetylmuramyl-(pentapeptide) pyrophosphoryl-undecaprenol N-acetylglucosamine transferase